MKDRNLPKKRFFDDLNIVGEILLLRYLFFFFFVRVSMPESLNVEKRPYDNALGWVLSTHFFSPLYILC